MDIEKLSHGDFLLKIGDFQEDTASYITSRGGRILKWKDKYKYQRISITGTGPSTILESREFSTLFGYYKKLSKAQRLNLIRQIRYNYFYPR